MTHDVSAHLPLHPRVLLMLSALLDGPLHGGALAQRIDALSGRTVRIGAATLYRTLDRLVGDGLLREREATSDGLPGRPGTPVTLTQLGRAVVLAEFARLQALGRAIGLDPQR